MSDPSSYANTDEVRVRDFALNLSANFETKVLSGSVTLNVEGVKDGADTLVLDSRDLTIHKATSAGKELEHKKGDTSEAFGTPIRISLASALKKGDKAQIIIEYETSPSSSAIQWLPPSQTAGKKHPYLFTQCQAIHARAMLPCQDTPSNKCPYTASVTVPAPLVALMSALRDGSSPSSDGKTITYNFKQPVPMPSYLVALGVGALEKREIGPRSFVWSEKEMVEAGAYEFAETEKFLAAAEAIVGPYVWTQYDILLLPPSFPYGGMENPCLTFVTPTLLAGDRSLANVIAHEIAHSWMGNLVSPTTWEHFWMNEGFTVFLERKIAKAVHGAKEMHLQATIGWKALRESVEHFGANHPYTALVPELKGVDPDDAFSSVPYEKGFNFLFYLENLVGGEELMNPFLRHHCETFKYKCIDSYTWKKFFLDYFKDKVDAAKLESIDWDTWYSKPGLPPTPEFDTTLVDAAHKLAVQLVEGKAQPEADNVKGFSSNQMVVFLEKILDLQAEELKAAGDKTDGVVAKFQQLLTSMDKVFDLTKSKNAEIRFRWFQACIRAEMESIFPEVASMLGEVGRMKFVRPLYRSLFASAKGKDFAVETFKKYRTIYHNIASKMVAKDLGL